MIKFFSDKLRVSSDKQIVSKATEFDRLAALRWGATGDQDAQIRSLLCVIIASQKYNKDVDPAYAIKVCGSQAKYHKSLTSLRHLLGIRATLSMKELCTKFKCPQIETFGTKILDLFRERYTAELPLVSRDKVDLSKSSLTVVAFIIAAKKHKVKVDRPTLVSLATTSDKELTQITADFHRLLPKELPPPKKTKTTSDKQRIVKRPKY